MSAPVCTACVLDVQDCGCDNCFCGACINNHCRCLVSSGETLDEMIEKASVPNLGALYKSAQKAGLIKPVPGYSSST